MSDGFAAWDDDLEDALENQGMYPDREVRSKNEDIQSFVLYLENQLELLRNDILSREITKQEFREIFDSMHNIQTEITKIKRKFS